MKILLLILAGVLAQAQSTLLQSWAGDVGTFSGTTPTYADRPDNGLAVGPTQVVQLTGQDFIIWSKTGTQAQNISAATFWSNAGAGFTGVAYDPRIYFDPFIGASGRFIAVVTDNGSGADAYCVSATTDATSGSTANWKCSTVPGSSPAQKDDTMRVGFDLNGVIMCHYYNTSNWSGYAFTNAALAWSGAGSPGTYSASTNALAYESMPAIDLNASKGATAPNVFITRSGGGQSGTNVAISIIATPVSWSGSTPTIGSASTISMSGWLFNTSGTSNTLNATQPGSPNDYYVGESHRTVPGTWDFSGKVWSAFESGPCQSSCGSLPTNNADGFFWFQLDPVAMTVSQSGYEFTTSNQTFQSVVTDSNNVTHFVTEYSNSSQYISLSEWYRLSTDTAGTLRGPYVQVAGTTTYPQGCGGDSPGTGVSYNTGVLDYYNQGTIWATGELGLFSTPCKWSTQVMQLGLTSGTGGTSVGGPTASGGPVRRQW